jgi:hypothetical protein
MKYLLPIVPLLISFGGLAQCDQNAIWNNTSTNEICTEINGSVKYWYTNSLPDHVTGTFPGQGNPHSISAQQTELTMCAYPLEAGEFTDLLIGGFNALGQCPTFEFGLATNGIEWDPVAAEWFENPNTGAINYDWNENALSPLVNLGTDMNDAHVQPTGKYHYHGDPTNFITGLGITSSEHSPIIGYAADGFPLYYKYIYADAQNSNSAIVEATSCFILKSGNRPGDGTTAPDGGYDGTYVEDFEYDGSLGGCLLDQCNGRFGVTPEFPNGTYYYVLTADYPVVPRCFAGTPDMSFSIGPPPAGCGVSNGESICFALSIEPSATEIADRLMIYPVPSNTGMLNVFIAGNQPIQPTQVSILDNSGKIVKTEAYQQRISINELKSGVYFLKFTFDKTEIIKRFVKK